MPNNNEIISAAFADTASGDMTLPLPGERA